MRAKGKPNVVASHELVVLCDEEIDVLVLEDREDRGDVLGRRATHHRRVVFAQREETVAERLQLLRDVTRSGQRNDLLICLFDRRERATTFEMSDAEETRGVNQSSWKRSSITETISSQTTSGDIFSTILLILSTA